MIKVYTLDIADIDDIDHIDDTMEKIDRSTATGTQCELWESIDSQGDRLESMLQFYGM